MAQGRFVSRSIAHNEELAEVSLEADYLFARCIPHLDVEGRMTGNPKLIKATAVPLRREIPSNRIPDLLAELAAAVDVNGEPLVRWYQVGGKQFLAFPGFARQQQNLRKEREAKSKIPGPDHPLAKPVTTRTPPPPPAAPDEEEIRNPEEVRSSSGVTPEEIRTNSRRREVKGSEDEDAVPSLTSFAQEPARGAEEFSTDEGGGHEDVRSLMGLVRRRFYVPDGKPPTHYSDDRDVSILRALQARGHTVQELESIIEGAALIRDADGVVGDERVDWLRRGEKLTMRAVYDTRKGPKPLWGLALQKLAETQNKRDGKNASAGSKSMHRLGAVLAAATKGGDS